VPRDIHKGGGLAGAPQSYRPVSASHEIGALAAQFAAGAGTSPDTASGAPGTDTDGADNTSIDARATVEQRQQQHGAELVAAPGTTPFSEADIAHITNFAPAQRSAAATDAMGAFVTALQRSGLTTSAAGETTGAPLERIRATAGRSVRPGG